MRTDKPRAWVSLPARPDVTAGLAAHLEVRAELEEDVDAPATLATKLPLADGASTHAIPSGAVAGAEPDVFAAGPHVVCARDNVALDPRTASVSRCARRAMTATVVDNVPTLSDHATNAGRPLTRLDSEVLARAGTSPHP